MLLQLMMSGISQGSIYALVALGMTVLFRATSVVNFAHGELLMLGAFAVFVLTEMVQLSLPVGAILAVVIVFFIGMGVERLLMRPLERAPHLNWAMMTIAFSFLARGLARLVSGRDVLSLQPIFTSPPMEIGDAVLAFQDVAITLTTLVLVGLFFVLFAFTRFGKIAQAASEAPRGAVLVGINLPLFRGTMWGVSAALAAVAGILVAPISMVYPEMGEQTLVRGFAAMTIGGFGNFGGAVVGGLLLGLGEQLSGGYVSTTLIDIFAYLVIIVVLLVFPSGLFGRKETTRV